MDREILCHQPIGNFHDDDVSLLRKNGRARGPSIDGDDQLLEAVRRLELILHVPLVVTNSSLRQCQRRENT